MRESWWLDGSRPGASPDSSCGYRIRPIYTTNESLQDARRGLRYLRTHANGFHIDPDRIGVIGFSAGAVLASNVALRAQPGTSDARDPIEREPSRAAFQILAYGSPGLLGRAGGENASVRKPMEWGAAPRPSSSVRPRIRPSRGA